MIGSYQGLSKATVKTVLLDFTKVEYINSSGIALVIQVLMEAANAGAESAGLWPVAALYESLHHGGDYEVRRAVSGSDGGFGYGLADLPDGAGVVFPGFVSLRKLMG